MSQTIHSEPTPTYWPRIVLTLASCALLTVSLGLARQHSTLSVLA